MPVDRGVGFLGRISERQILDGMLARARDGQSAVLVIRGEPGIGKTALLRYAARQASGLRVAQVEGVEAEMELPFAGIHRLCAPALDRLDGLPEPQRNALSVALGMSAGETPDRFLVALAVLSLLCAVAEERPLLCLVDDAQWLDSASLIALGFVARRLLAESIAIVFALREPIATHGFDGLPELALGGLDDADAAALLSLVIQGRLDGSVRDRIIAETGGNPLALVELSRTMSAAEKAGGYALPRARDVPGRVEEQYRRRVGTLPEATQLLILLASADPLGDATLVWRAAERLSIDASALAPATEAGLLEVDVRVRFRHPLVRSAVYRAASEEHRRRVHEALADASDPDRRAWHRALATVGPDDEVAAELERWAAAAQTRGGRAAAAAFLERSAALTADAALCRRRALAAAQTSFEAGDFEAALRLLSTAESHALDTRERALVALLRGHIAFASGQGTDAPARLMLTAARELEVSDLAIARRAYLMAWRAAVAAGHPRGTAVLVEICHAVRSLPQLPEGPHPLDLLLDGLARLTTDGRAAATPVLQRAAKAIVDLPAADVLRWGALAVAASSAIWDSDGATAISERQVQIVRAAAALAELPTHLSALATEKTWIGDFAAAEALVAESAAVAAATGSRMPPFALIRLRSLQGREAEAAALIESTILRSESAGHGTGANFGRWAAAVLYNGLGRHDLALAHAREATVHAIDPWQSLWALPELIEAAARVGDVELARDGLGRLTVTTQPAGTDFALGIEARSRALMTDGVAAERLYREAIDRLRRARLRPELARAHLVFGEWLRHEGRRVDAREQLSAAEDMFATIGMEAFAARAARELAAAGAKVRKRPVEASDQLTPQEEQIARLARDGLTNGEIGGQLFLSPRTVEWHLHKVFAKLGINSRSGLDSALPTPERPRAPSR
jgi:DNA-binding CsgD family transcriptional regulator